MISVATALSLVALILGLTAGILAWLAKYAVDRRDKAIDERLEGAEKADDEHKKELSIEVKDLTMKLHERELAHTKLEGEVKLLSKSNETVERDLKEIKDEMVPRAEWREATARLEDKIDKFVRFSQWRPTPGMMHAVRPIPREEGALDEYKTTPPRRGT